MRSTLGITKGAKGLALAIRLFALTQQRIKERPPEEKRGREGCLVGQRHGRGATGEKPWQGTARLYSKKGTDRQSLLMSRFQRRESSLPDRETEASKASSQFHWLCQEGRQLLPSALVLIHFVSQPVCREEVLWCLLFPE